MKHTLGLVALSIFFYSLTLYAGQQGSERRLGDRPAPESAWSALDSSMEKMHVAMAFVRSSGDSDVDFVRLMLPHHQAAIDMAKIQLLYGKDPQVRRLALEIITDQQSEIELMQLWLKQRDVVTFKSNSKE